MKNNVIDDYCEIPCELCKGSKFRYVITNTGESTQYPCVCKTGYSTLPCNQPRNGTSVGIKVEFKDRKNINVLLDSLKLNCPQLIDPKIEIVHDLQIVNKSIQPHHIVNICCLITWKNKDYDNNLKRYKENYSA